MHCSGMTEQQIIEILSSHFDVKLTPQKCDCGVDAVISLRADSEVRAYIICKNNINDEQEWTAILNRAKEALSIPDINCVPVVAITQKNAQPYIGILSYCEYDKYYLNRNISWKILNDENMIWLAIQLRAHRGSIRFLPQQFFRIEKIITLNSSSLLNGQVRYLRTFGERYRIKRRSALSTQEQFSRNVYGTPEEDYPQDVLDNIIFKAVQKAYPEAQRQSCTILFDSDLLNRRILNEAKIDHQKIYAVDISTGTQKPIADLEVYYYYNVWKETKVREIAPKLECNNIDELERVMSMINEKYEPLSRLNI